MFYPATEEGRAEERRRLGWRPERPVVLFVGRLVPEKGIGLLIEAADPRFDLVLCGPASGKPIDFGPIPNLSILPARPRSELRPLYQAADLVVLPSLRREGFPLVAQEALACGTPVILSEDEGYDPYRQLSGLFFSPREPVALRRLIFEILQRCREGGRTTGEQVTPGGTRAWAMAIAEGLRPDWLSPGPVGLGAIEGVQ
jgi:glycosyltransferase involved in cell wall biosynthesis